MAVVATAKDVGRTKTTNTEQLVVRVPPALRERLEALIPRLAPAGVSITMTDVVRAALIHGVEVLEAKHDLTPKAARGRK